MRLGPVIAGYRKVNRIGTRELARLIGISVATLNRVERGHTCDSTTLASIFTWLLTKDIESQGGGSED